MLSMHFQFASLDLAAAARRKVNTAPNDIWRREHIRMAKLWIKNSRYYRLRLTFAQSGKGA